MTDPVNPTQGPPPWWADLLVKQGPVTLAFLVMLGLFTGMLPSTIRTDMSAMRVELGELKGRLALCEKR